MHGFASTYCRPTRNVSWLALGAGCTDATQSTVSSRVAGWRPRGPTTFRVGLTDGVEWCWKSISIFVHPELETKLRTRADEEGITVDAYLERLFEDEAAEIAHTSLRS